MSMGRPGAQWNSTDIRREMPANQPSQGADADLWHNRGEWIERLPLYKRLTRNELAERVRFELTLEFPLNTLSKRAPSATRPPLQGAVSFLNLP